MDDKLKDSFGENSVRQYEFWDPCSHSR